MIKVLLFAQLQEESGQNEINLELAPITIKQLKELLIRDYSIRTFDNVMVAVNEEFAQEEEVVKNGDIVAFIPPVSGG
ncbi:molybdopterin converting factor subunit 1 [Halalkalibacter hemicellulosilyticus]|uniref:Molybdopterin synthase sulfur carrier subunit n=1 Tax=Halalkalibacter hemicellulosilyticusJCM 9152 TaxID=1236971 RepID=W4QK34_9BACI|nr:molybdopterin converting factor subunit 1 [Halalkalibacter hemicellulosilyticus]GAE32470.1 molybdopterin converting factor [Halalkalibacter hemicellulosilyticusJCM 9152]